MRRTLATLTALAAGALTAAALAAPAANARAAEPDTLHTATLKVGDMAPDFTLLSDDWKPITLSDYHGKNNVILAFYVLAFSGG